MASGSYKTVVIQKQGPRQRLDDIEQAALKWLDGFNIRRLQEPIGNLPPVDYEVQYYHKPSHAMSRGQTKILPVKPERCNQFYEKAVL